jgi:CBS domain containing-hemolysin-like protein
MIEGKENIFSKTETGQQSFFDWVKSFFSSSTNSVRNDIEDALDDTTGHEFTLQEKTILKNVLSLHEFKVNDIKIPRADIVAVSIHSTLAEVLKLFRSAGHSRLPVFGDTLDDVRGMLHIRDFVDYIASAVENEAGKKIAPHREVSSTSNSEIYNKRRLALASLNLDSLLEDSKIIRPILYVPPSMPTLDVLVKMQSMRTHMALVIDEYGGTDGLVSIEDIVETIVGNIQDEHDEDESPVLQLISDGIIIADGRADLAEFLKLSQSQYNEDDIKEIDTLSGFITSSLGYVPSRGQIIKIKNMEYEVLDADPRRVKKIRIRFSPHEDL